MDSNLRMNLGDKESNFVEFFMPMTPGKTMPAPSDPDWILMDGHGSQLGYENWEQPATFMNPSYNGTVRQFSTIEQPGRSGNPIGKTRLINHIAGSYAQALQSEGAAGWNGSFLSLLAMTDDTTSNGSSSITEMPIGLNLHSWQPSSAEFVLANQNHCSNSDVLCSNDVLAGIPQYGFPVPYNPPYGLDSSPSIETYGTSTVTNSFQFEPVTCSEKCTNGREKQQQDKHISTDSVTDEHIRGVFSENIVDTSSAIVSVLSEEPRDAVICKSTEQPKACIMLSDETIDLNKTPRQKTPKRRKHRPKVIVEGKSKRTPKAANMKTPDPEKKASEKRKYILKVQQESAMSHPDSVGEITCYKEHPKEKRKYVCMDLKEPASGNADYNAEMEYATSRTSEPSCRKALNFDSENVIIGRENNPVAQQKLLNKETETSRLSTGFQVTEPIKPTGIIGRRETSLQMSQQNRLISEKSEAICNLAPSKNSMLADNSSNPGRKEAGISYLSVSNWTGADLNANVRDTNIRNQQFLCSDRTGQTSFHFDPQSQSSPYLEESRRSKREYCQAMQTSHGTNNQFRKEMYATCGYSLNSCVPNEVCPETRKKKKIVNGIKTNIDGIFPFAALVDRSRASASSNNVNSVASPSETNREILNLYLKRNEVKRENSEPYRFPVHSGTQSTLSGQDNTKHNMYGSRSHEERSEENFRGIMLRTLASANKHMASSMLPPTPKASSRPGDRVQHTNCNITFSSKQAIVPFQSQYVPSKEYKMLPAEMLVFNGGQSPEKRKGRAAKQKFPVTVEDIIYRMENLNLNETKGNALVPYKGDGTLIPYEGSIKKRKPRPKVDLDAETERVWKLLMWKEGNEDEETDERKRKWWDEERRVFHGRADSFIARMHLVQGDRRFSKWKGSVVDSVIGVFLTQNVSDHLSSSAFMSLAARFPPKPTTNRMCHRNGSIILVEEPDLFLQNLNDKLQEKLLRHPFYTNSSMTPPGLEEHQLESETSCTERTGRLKGNNHGPEEVLSSQDSFDSSVIQGNGVSGSNSEAEDPANGYKCNKNHNTGSSDLQSESTTSFADFYCDISGSSLFPEKSRHQSKQQEDIEYKQQQIRSERTEYSHKVSSTFNQKINNSNLLMQIPTVPSSNYQFTTLHSGVLEVESLDSHREESISSWPSSTSISNKEKDAGCTSIVQGAENATRTMTTQYESTRYKSTPLIGSCRSRPHEINKSFDLESQSPNDPVNLADEQNNSQLISNITKLTGNLLGGEARIDMVRNQQTPSTNKLVESGSNDQVKNKVNLNVKTVKARKDKSKAVSENKETVDWDCLRKQAMANSVRKEKSKDAMDSLDYEAMRRASVNQISDTIRERGMNNLLAERIKEFLDRLVREHGSVDLEWLRDVPPDKAKEYLLSIRGLGLKSVECVRLLTLHHLAFPVDTNVGRIAVRLGWVPLQPLPESLQLHLLELYPILESIQKYLWPRLCKLDQRTLYELHYQMITFGKVFCTKSRPNCNACPMRAECRHFASAFASARLALPGPEEKSIVTHTVPLTTASGPRIIINPMPLPPPEDNKLKRVANEIVSCVPIVEEPRTPEQEKIEVTESDIEDVFKDDSHEIPTIKLNMDELSENLQNYMQANMDLQEFDMSKALVALNPEAASIPTPKLKNISRLRTEHNVYEIPDEHPLLYGMDRREPDDPSPYLLAIWTPGETAESIQPPGKHCQSQEPDKLCNEQTCFSCNSIREANSQIVRGTLLIPCRTAMRGSFPLNGTYFQVNEMFADHASSLDPIDVPRAWIWNLPRRMVYFGTSVSTIFKGLTTEEIQYCFWRGFVCVRGFDQKTRAPRPLLARLHFPASKLAKTKNVP